jgi:hypothetical protein
VASRQQLLRDMLGAESATAEPVGAEVA